jgi:hypothetical protein
MGVFIQWTPPHAEAPYDQTHIYRAIAQLGPFTLIHTQAASDDTYYDLLGNTSSWYRVQFFDTVSGTPSAFSDPVQPGTLLGYCTPEDLRTFTNLDTTDLSDEQFCRIIPYAGAQVNHDIQVYHFEERIDKLDNSRLNTVDGVNTNFYLKHFNIGDANNDMEVTISDLIVTQVAQDGIKTIMTIASIDESTGLFVLETAPIVGSYLVVTYYSAPLSVATPHLLVRLATVYLVASIAYSKINIGKSTTIKLGSQAFVRHMKSYAEYYDKYQKILAQINNRMANAEEGYDFDGQIGVYVQ